VNKVPFPALESFEDRIRFPKRYFIFFDVFVRAGRHNRTLWMNTIQRDKGQNEMRFGPAIFEAHVRTTIRENYFKWIFQLLCDIEEVKDEDVLNFQLEYDENVYTNLPKTLACTHKEITRFPFEDYELFYGRDRASTSPQQEGRQQDVANILPGEIATEDQQVGGNAESGNEDDNGYCSANSNSSTSDGEESITSSTGRRSVNQSVASSTGTRSVNPASSPEGSAALTREHQEHNRTQKEFFLLDKKIDKNRFNAIREKQRRDLKDLIEKRREDHKDILPTLKETIMRIRRVKRNQTSENDPKAKEAIAEAKKNLRLFKEAGDVESEGPAKKKYRRSIDNQTRLPDSKVSFFAKANDAMKLEETGGVRKLWEMLYKRIWNEQLLAAKDPVFSSEPIPRVKDISRDLEDDVDQLLMDSMSAYEEV